MTKTLIIALVTATLIGILTFKKSFKKSFKKEDFTADGLVFNRPSEWWYPETYNVIDWLVPMFPDQLSQPQCLSYNRGDPGVLNFNSVAYRMWRF